MASGAAKFLRRFRNYALGDAEKMRRGFQKLISIPLASVDEDDDLEDLHPRSPSSPAKDGEAKGGDAKDDAKATATRDLARADGLRHELKRREKEAHGYMLTAARLIAPELKAPDDAMVGYRLIIDALKPDHELLASEMEIERALKYMRNKDFDKAIEALKAFEKKDQHLKAMAATNLSFIYFLEGDLRAAERYADLAYEQDRYSRGTPPPA